MAGVVDHLDHIVYQNPGPPSSTETERFVSSLKNLPELGLCQELFLGTSVHQKLDETISRHQKKTQRNEVEVSIILNENHIEGPEL